MPWATVSSSVSGSRSLESSRSVRSRRRSMAAMRSSPPFLTRECAGTTCPYMLPYQMWPFSSTVYRMAVCLVASGTTMGSLARSPSLSCRPMP